MAFRRKRSSSATITAAAGGTTAAPASAVSRFVSFFKSAIDVVLDHHSHDENADVSAMGPQGGGGRSKRAKRTGQTHKLFLDDGDTTDACTPQGKEMRQFKGPLLTPAHDGHLVEKIGLDPLQQDQQQQQQQQQQPIPFDPTALTNTSGKPLTPRSRSRVRAQLRSFYKLSPLTPTGRLRR